MIVDEKAGLSTTMMPTGIGRSIFCSPRPINPKHGTGVQVSHLLRCFPELLSAINFGIPERGQPDLATTIESHLATAWPFRYAGRRFWHRVSDRFKLSFWQGNCLNDRGKRFVRQLISNQGAINLVGIINDESTAQRFNSIRDATEIPHVLLMYDLVLGGAPSPHKHVHLARAIRSASEVFSISIPLSEACKILGASSVQQIGFFRPSANPSVESQRLTDIDKTTRPLKILVLAQAAPEPLRELTTTVSALNSGTTPKRFEIHFVGDPPPMAIQSDVIFHGFVSDERRDAIGAGCDLAFLAGPAKPAKLCPFSQYSVPSKLSDFACLGLPVVARIAEDSAAGLTIKSGMENFVRAISTASELHNELVLAANSQTYLSDRRKQAYEFANSQVILPASAMRFINALQRHLAVAI